MLKIIDWFVQLDNFDHFFYSKRAGLSGVLLVVAAHAHAVADAAGR